MSLGSKFAEFPNWRRKYAYIELLISVSILILAGELIQDVTISNGVIPTIGAISLVSACLAISESSAVLRKNLLLVLVGATAWILAVSVDAHPFNSDYFRIGALGFGFVFVVFVGVVMLGDIFKSPVTMNRICGAICVYMLLGIGFALLHTIALTIDPKAYAFDSPEDRTKYMLSMDNGSSLTYFSFCTLSTVGYGDIVPVHKLARVFSWLEAVLGQLYLSILVARLVGLYIADETADRQRKDQLAAQSGNSESEDHIAS